MQPFPPHHVAPAKPLQRLAQWFTQIHEKFRAWVIERSAPALPARPTNLTPLLAADPEVWERPTQPMRRSTRPLTPPRIYTAESGQRYIIASHQATGGFGKYRYAVDGAGMAWASRELVDEEALREIDLLKRLKSRLGVHDEIKSDGRHWAIMPLFGGELVDAFARIKEASTRKALARLAVSQLATDLLRCHQNGYVHRDVKIASALWHADGSIVLSDYSQAKPRDAKGSVTGGPTTMGYAAPEMILGGEYADKVDVWSLAMAYSAMHDNRLQRLFALAHRNQELIVAYLRWRQGVLGRKGPLVIRLAQHHDRWDEYFLALAQADPEMGQLLLERMLEPKSVNRATMEEVQTAMRRLQPPGCAAEREVVRALQNLADGDSKRDAAIMALRTQIISPS